MSTDTPKGQVWLADVSVPSYDVTPEELGVYVAEQFGFTDVEVLWHSAALPHEDAYLIHDVEAMVAK